MIGTINVKCNAAHPEMALPALYSFAGSPSSIRVSEVPKKIGNWQITNVRINAVYPDGTMTTADCVLVGGVWVGTIAGSTTVGTTQNGYAIYADGVDENENPVVGYVLGKGDLTVLESDGEEQPSTPTTFIKLLDEERETPIEGDMWPGGGGYYIWQNDAAKPIGVTASDLSAKADLSAVEEVAASLSDYYTKSETSSAAELSTAFNLKQDNLASAQLAAIDYDIDKLATVIKYNDNTVSTYNIYGTLQRENIHVNDKGIVEAKIGYGVSVLAPYMFTLDRATLSAVKIPDSVVDIRIQSFDGCSNLVSVELPESVTKLDNYEFKNCHALKTAKMYQNGLVYFGMFYGCKQLSAVEIGNKINGIGSNAFYNCDALSSITIPDSVQFIGSSAFEDCDGLQEVYIGDGVKSISERAFRNCANLKKVTIGKNVQSITTYVFYGCSSLTEVVFKGKTLAEVQAMSGYPWGISDTSIITTYNEASQEWVLEQLSALLTQLQGGN